ncbi:hypothetical protein MICA_1060 [Micavibrio aeruginosavorus ARL-13]|uniref:Uncharacterized protein n=2 Tax=Micavibrio aeruginosavorus TaxID=349221 RepID=G2KN55_MICAA|nr:hypothetical protein MICA_1060 [Micavibrio aeruginosavorus ARL-13]
MTKNFLIVRHYPRTINRLTLAESAKECAEIFSVGTVITLLFVTGAILLGSIYVIVTDAVGDGAGISHFIGNTFSLIIFCTATYIASLMLIEKIKAIKHTK